jgi:hypothetical protein
MGVNTLKEALHDKSLDRQSTENARSAAAAAIQQAEDMVNRLNEQVQREVAKAAGALVNLSRGK